MELAPDAVLRPCRRVALLVDGENMPAGCADAALEEAKRLGRVVVQRVYRDAARTCGWTGVAGFRTIHTGDARGKNAADMALAIDAVELALRGMADAFVLVTSDGDFTGLALWLREHGFPVTGVGKVGSAVAFQAACDRFREVPGAGTAPPPQQLATVEAANGVDPSSTVVTPPPTKILLAQVDNVLGAVGGEGWIAIQLLGTLMGSRHGVRIADTPQKTWRRLLNGLPARYELEPKSPNARVRLRQRAP